MATGNFGISYEYHQPVFNVIKEYLPFTIIFALSSFVIQFILGALLAIYTVRKKQSALEKAVDNIALAVYSLPTFLIGVILVYIFSLTLNIFPSADIYSTSFNDKNILEKAYDLLVHSVLPLITLSLPGVVVFYRYTKENILALMDKSFICYLTANGIDEKEIYRKHIFPNILPQLISLSGVELSILLSGALITEVLYNLPGMGRLTVTAILQRDYPLIVACTFISGLFVLICNFTGEIVRSIIDRRLIKEIFT
jgi:peptide/nickel transport system permease protein